MAPFTAEQAAQVLAQQGKHSHLHVENESVCISGNCTPTPAVLGTHLLTPPYHLHSRPGKAPRGQTRTVHLPHTRLP